MRSQRSETSWILAAERSLHTLAIANTQTAGNRERNDILLNLLSLNNTLTLLPINRPLLLLQPPDRINARHSTTRQTRHPSPVSVILQPLRARQLPHTDRINDRNRIQSQVARIAELTTHSQIPQDGVNGALVIQRDRRGFEVFDKFTDAQDLPGYPELLLDCVEWVDAALGSVRAVEVPGEETREVLECAQDLVAADWFNRVSLVIW